MRIVPPIASGARRATRRLVCQSRPVRACRAESGFGNRSRFCSCVGAAIAISSSDTDIPQQHDTLRTAGQEVRGTAVKKSNGSEGAHFRCEKPLRGSNFRTSSFRLECGNACLRRSPAARYVAANDEVCPIPAIRNARRDRLSWVETGPSALLGFSLSR